mmetsp:Transcript_65181/g.194330  ORF Transcript_65181/g.194330 Transcript_65181/m.194330 type:complete len:383 (-) Transcript_65181:99-1247(-)
MCGARCGGRRGRGRGRRSGRGRQHHGSRPQCEHYSRGKTPRTKPSSLHRSGPVPGTVRKINQNCIIQIGGTGNALLGLRLVRELLTSRRSCGGCRWRLQCTSGRRGRRSVSLIELRRGCRQRVRQSTEAVLRLASGRRGIESSILLDGRTLRDGLFRCCRRRCLFSFGAQLGRQRLPLLPLGLVLGLGEGTPLLGNDLGADGAPRRLLRAGGAEAVAAGEEAPHRHERLLPAEAAPCVDRLRLREARRVLMVEHLVVPRSEEKVDPDAKGAVVVLRGVGVLREGPREPVELQDAQAGAKLHCGHGDAGALCLLAHGKHLRPHVVVHTPVLRCLGCEHIADRSGALIVRTLAGCLLVIPQEGGNHQAHKGHSHEVEAHVHKQT